MNDNAILAGRRRIRQRRRRSMCGAGFFAAAAVAAAAASPSALTASSRPTNAFFVSAFLGPPGGAGVGRASYVGRQPRALRISRTEKERSRAASGRPAYLGGTYLSAVNGGDVPSPTEPQVYPQRWVQLAYLSVLALLSDWICFSVAASPAAFEVAYPGSSAPQLIDIFLFTNVFSCFFVTDVVAKYGLGRAIKSAAGIMTVGCLLRSGIPAVLTLQNWIDENSVANAASTAVSAVATMAAKLESEIGTVERLASSALPNAVTDLVDPSTLTEASRLAGLEPYSVLVLGTVLVGFAQPYFQCTPPLLSASWFGANERATATATALNFNQIGIAVAFLVGGQMAGDESGIHVYFGIITALCLLTTIGTFIQFEDRPPSPPSYSEMEKWDREARGEREPPFLESVKIFFKTPGFTLPLAAFVCSISITNIVGTFIDDIMRSGGVTDQLGVDLAGAAFELAILAGGIVIGGYVDETKRYKTVTLACLAATMFFVVPLGLTDHYLGSEPALLVLALLGLGVSCGPIQPINAELAVDVTYPGDETAVESVQQVGGNLVSALMVPVAEWALSKDYEIFGGNRIMDSDIRGDVVLLFGVAAVTLAYFTTFDAPLLRTAADQEGEEAAEEAMEEAMEEVAEETAAAAEGGESLVSTLTGAKEDERVAEPTGVRSSK